MTDTSLTERFGRLPTDVRERVFRIVNLTLGMDEPEKSTACQLINDMALYLAKFGADADVPAAELLSALRQLVLSANREAHPRTTTQEAV